MKLLATPLLEPGSGEAFAVDDLHSRRFVDLLDQHKALIFQRAPTGDDAGAAALTADDFGDILVNLQLEHYAYIGGAAPRTIIPVKAGDNIVFTANERYVDDIL